MVLFDKGNQILKSMEFKKDKKEWLYQLKNASEVADRADAAVALGKLKAEDEAAAALGNAVTHGQIFWCAKSGGRSTGDAGRSGSGETVVGISGIHQHAVGEGGDCASPGQFQG